MEKQLIVSIGRQYGSAGHEIGEKLAQKLDIPFYDRNLFDVLSKVKNIDTNNLVKFDEKPKNRFFSRTVRGYSSSPEENYAELQFALLKSKAADGDSFVIVGRCADELFRGREGFVSIFVTGDLNERIKRIMDVRNMDERMAKLAIDIHDRKRRQYHDYFCKGGKWADVGTYDLVINSTKLGIDGTVDFLYQYIQEVTK